MSTQYFLSDGLNIHGPFERDKIVEMLKLSQISMGVHCREIDSDTWVQLFMHEDFPEAKSYKHAKQAGALAAPVGLIDDGISSESEDIGVLDQSASAPDWVGDLGKFNKSFTNINVADTDQEPSKNSISINSPKTKPDLNRELPPIEAIAAQPSEDLWEMKIGNTILGPYKFLKMLKLIKMGDLREYDLVRKSNERNWQEAHTISEFSQDHLVAFEDPLIKELLERKIFRRQQNRKDYRGSITVYDGAEIYHLECADLSAGGVAFFSTPPLFSPQQVILVRFEDVPLSEGYHAKSQIVRAEKVLVGTENPIIVNRYAVHFLEVTPDAKKWIELFLQSR